MKKEKSIKILINTEIDFALFSFFESDNRFVILFEFKDIFIEVNDIYPFFALVKLREQLEKMKIFLLCKGSRIDVYPSGMSAIGFFAYQTEFGKHATQLVSIWEEELDVEVIATVKTQKQYHQKWLESF